MCVLFYLGRRTSEVHTAVSHAHTCNSSRTVSRDRARMKRIWCTFANTLIPRYVLHREDGTQPQSFSNSKL